MLLQGVFAHLFLEAVHDKDVDSGAGVVLARAHVTNHLSILSLAPLAEGTL